MTADLLWRRGGGAAVGRTKKSFFAGEDDERRRRRRVETETRNVDSDEIEDARKCKKYCKMSLSFFEVRVRKKNCAAICGRQRVLLREE